jgi:hypothetical protein
MIRDGQLEARGAVAAVTEGGSGASPRKAMGKSGASRMGRTSWWALPEIKIRKFKRKAAGCQGYWVERNWVAQEKI